MGGWSCYSRPGEPPHGRHGNCHTHGNYNGHSSTGHIHGGCPGSQGGIQKAFTTSAGSYKLKLQCYAGTWDGPGDDRFEVSTDGGGSWAQYTCRGGAWRDMEHSFTASGSSDIIVWANVGECIDVDDIKLESCEGDGSPATTTSTTTRSGPPPEAAFGLESGSPCTVKLDGGRTCVTSPGHPGNYGDSQNCQISVQRPTFVLDVRAFDTEAGFDVLTVDGVAYSGSAGPEGTLVTHGSTISWRSDVSIVRTGWRICNGDDVPWLGEDPLVLDKDEVLLTGTVGAGRWACPCSRASAPRGSARASPERR